MLVLSRRINEKIILPTVNIAIQVVGVKTGVVRLGIDAPPDVTVYREEVLDRAGPGEFVPPPATDGKGKRAGKLSHELRNRLNAIAIGMALLKGQLRAGANQDAEAVLHKVNQEIESLSRQLEAPQTAAPPPAPPVPAKVRKALLVEDDRNECELMAGFLRYAGYDVTTAGDGSDALDYLNSQGRPDVMLLDMVLPRCDGASTVRAIRQNPAYAGLKIFAVSGYPPEQFGLGQGPPSVDRWFRKPLNPEALLRELEHEVGTRA
jgi:carbon storage regulator CsrA